MSYDFDLIVVGGGSGGISASKNAADLGAKVLVCDFVTPSPQGTTWGVGGTCVNVGCIPKKLYHTSGLIGDTISMAKTYGWKIEPQDFEKEKGKYCDWKILRENIVKYVKSLNVGTEGTLETKKIVYNNAYARFVDPHKIEMTFKDGHKEYASGKYIILAMGGRPRFPPIPGAKEYGISSDDIFHMEEDPGKTLVIGASYIALECCGFLNGIGRDTTVMVRSICLRGFDRSCAKIIIDAMEHHGVKFLQPVSPTKIEKLENGRLKVFAKSNKEGDDTTYEDEYDSVFIATGRTPCTSGLGLEEVGVKLGPNKKVLVNDVEQSSVPHIYAIGDIIDQHELTPVAIQTGRLLVRRLFGNSEVKMDYEHVATTVFTPLEYGTIGYGEEEAVKEFGRPFITVWESDGGVLEHTMDPFMKKLRMYFKIITYKFDDDRVVGFHYIGPNAGEITQAFAIAMKCGLKKDQLDISVGIHPTVAEGMTTMYQLKKSAKEGCST